METLIGETDRISQLPDFIIHHILSFLNNTWDGLPAPELVRMSVLSKTWFHLTASFPILDFYINDVTYSRESFFKYIDYTTSRFCHQDVTAHRFKLVTTIEEPAELDVVNRCLELVLKKGVKVLDIDLFGSMPMYCLPNTLLSVSVLESLIINGCGLPSSLMLDAVKFKSLIQLKLEDIHIDDEAIKCLASSCPLLEEFHIICCHGFKRFCVCGHQKLQRVAILYNIPVERIDIEAPNLSDISVTDWGGRGAPRMNLGSCKKLTTVSYFGLPFPNSNGFTGFLSNFPFVEDLFLTTIYKGNNLKFSSHFLRTFVLYSDCDLAYIELFTPNLGLFIYSSNRGLPLPQVAKHWSSVRDSTHLKPCMQCYPDGSVDAFWFQKLRLFLDKKNGFKVFNLYIHPKFSQKFTELEKLKAIELPPYELEHVDLYLESRVESSDHIAFVDYVLWCCRPRSLTLRSSSPDFEEQSDVVKFTYGKLLQQEDEDHTKIQIVSPSSSGAQQHLMELKSLSMALPCEGKAISFIKEEVVKEEAG